MGTYYVFLALLAVVGALIPMIAVTVAGWRIHSKHRLEVRPSRTPTTPDRLTPEMRGFLSTALEQFQSRGFNVVENLFQEHPSLKATSIQVLLVNRQSCDVGAVTLIKTTVGRVLTLSVTSSFIDGTRVATGSRRSVGVFPKRPWVDAQSFAWIRDASVIYDTHIRRLEKMGKADLPRVAPAAGEELKYVDNLWDEEVHWASQCGYMYLDTRANAYRYTLKGVVLSLLKMLPPMKTIRQKIHQRRSRRAWAELGMEKLEMPVRETESTKLTVPSDSIDGTISPSGGQLDYAVQLRPGELRSELNGGTLILRMGAETPLQYLRRKWLSILIAALILALFGLNFFIRLQYWLAWRKVLPIGIGYLISFPAIFPIIVLLPSIRRFWQGLSSLRGTILVTAAESGLTFENAPGRPSGQIPRDAIERLSVIVDEFTLRGRRWRLQVRQHAQPKAQVLFRGADRSALTTARLEILRSLGMEV